MSHKDALRLARLAVIEAQAWIDRIDETGIFHPGEMDDALDAYHDAAEWFFTLYDKEQSNEP